MRTFDPSRTFGPVAGRVALRVLWSKSEEVGTLFEAGATKTKEHLDGRNCAVRVGVVLDKMNGDPGLLATKLDPVEFFGSNMMLA